MEVVLGLLQLLHHSVSPLQSTHFIFQLPFLLLVLQFLNLIPCLLDGLLKLHLHERTARCAAGQTPQDTSPAFNGVSISLLSPSIWCSFSCGRVGKSALQTGHWQSLWTLQYSPMQPRQKQCPQGMKTGLLNPSRQIQLRHTRSPRLPVCRLLAAETGTPKTNKSVLVGCKWTLHTFIAAKHPSMNLKVAKKNKKKQLQIFNVSKIKCSSICVLTSLETSALYLRSNYQKYEPGQEKRQHREEECSKDQSAAL